MSDALYRAERCRDLEEEFRRLSEMCTLPEMRNHYSQMAEHFSSLAEAKNLGFLAGNKQMT
jgi:hypothetical protein